MVSPTRRTRILQLLSIGIGAAIWMVPVPEGLQPAAWHLFAIFTAAIFAVVSAAASILVASIVALVVSIFSGTLEPSVAYGGFSQGFILLIVVAFLVGKGVVNRLYSQMMIDDEWSVRRDSGFTWWGFELARNFEEKHLLMYLFV